MKKKGGLTSTQLVIIVLVLAGFGILAFVFSQIAFTGRMDRETCHTSVIARATALQLTKDTFVPVPLKCKTNKICATTNALLRGECQNSFDKFDTLRISAEGKKMDNQIKMALGREMVDCWTMMGEGRVSIFEKEFLRSDKTYCVVCSRIAFDESVLKNKKELTGFSAYLINYAPYNQNRSYMEIITNKKAGQIKRGQNIFQEDEIDLNQEQAIIFIQARRGLWGSLVGGIAGAAGGTLVGAKIGFAVGSFVPVVGNALGFIVGATVGAGITWLGVEAGDSAQVILDSTEGDYGSGVVLIPYNSEEIKKLKCSSFENLP
jgi:hypothetical protein